MKFNDCPLKSELTEGLIQYERDNNISPLSLIESLLEKFLYDEGYLVTGAGDNVVPFPSNLNHAHLKYTTIRENGNLQIRKDIGGKIYTYGAYKEYDIIKRIIEFLKSKDWNVKYSTMNTKLRGEKQIEFLLCEMEKEGWC